MADLNAAPIFSVLLPAKGRPALAREALVSVLEQSFGDLEVIVSNNGADAALRDAIADRLDDPRVRYVEHPVVLPMPQHWEKISQLARGRYLTVLTDRSVLKQGALATIADLHDRGGSHAEIVTWAWDLYHSDSGFLQTFAGRSEGARVLDSDTVALDSLRIGSTFAAALPRGLNSSVSQSLIHAIRARTGGAFQPINPDFTFAFACLMSHPRITYAGKALMISQGLSVSNGGNAYLTDASDYIRTLGLSEPLPYSPVKAPLIENIIAEDFLAICHQLGRQDLLEGMDWADFYLKCLAELDEKRAAGLLPRADIERLAADVQKALAANGPEIQARVLGIHRRSSNFTTHTRRAAKRLLGHRVELVRSLLARMRRGPRFQSALQAAGHRGA